MEKHTIKSLDQLVHVMLHPVVLLQATSGQVACWLAESIKLKEALRRQLFLDTLDKTEEELELLVERHQIIVTTLLDLLFAYQQHESINRDQKQFYQQVTAQLEEIIVFLKNNFARHFNTDLLLPLSLRLRNGNELKRRLNMIGKVMSGAEANSHLLHIMERLITGLLQLKEETPATYYQVDFLKNLMKEIADYFSTTPCLPLYASITELLISWNFNDPVFIRYVCTNFKTGMENVESAECKLEFLQCCYKRVVQLLEINNTPFYATQPAAQRSILDYLTQELAHLESTMASSETKEVCGSGKIQTSLSVPALALFIRLFKDAGIYTNTNQEELLKFVSSHYTTQRKLEISSNHLHSKYYQVDEATKSKVYEHLMYLAQLCKKI